MKRLLLIALLLSASLPAKALNLSGFPKIPEAVRDACIINGSFYFLTDKGVMQGTLNGKKWELKQITTRAPQDKLWTMQCHDDLLPGPAQEISVSRVRLGIWRSFVISQIGDGWKLIKDELPFEIRLAPYGGKLTWIGDSRFPQSLNRGEFSLLESTENSVKLGKKVKLPHGSILDNWVQLANGDMAVLRDFHLEIYTNTPRHSHSNSVMVETDEKPDAKPGKANWKLRQRLPGGSQTTLCTESQPDIWSSIGVMTCRQLAPLQWKDRLIVPHNKILLDQVLSQVPMIEHTEIHIMQWDEGLESYQVVGTLGPLPGELASYFIDKNPQDGVMTLFLVVMVRDSADAWGGLTNYSLLVPVAFDSLPKSGS